METISVENVLIISSQVAASMVGAAASSFCLQSLGLNTFVLPTTLLGRHPGWGAPGGGVIPAAQLSDMWDAIAQQDIVFDGVLCGYMGEPEHIDLAVKLITQLRAKNPELKVLVDPVMGDHGKLYVEQEIARGIVTKLVALADYITPNVWELSVITGQELATPQDIYKATSKAKAAIVATSVETDNEIGTMLIQNGVADVITHERLPRVPHGGGDSFAGMMLGHILNGLSASDALAKATASIYEIFENVTDADKGELPLVRLQNKITSAAPLPIERFTP